MHTISRSLFKAARRTPIRQFDRLYSHLAVWDILWSAWENVQRNNGSPGFDHQTIQSIEWGPGAEVFLGQIQRELREGTYRPSPLRAVTILKEDGGRRILSIPTVKDRVVQSACKLLLEPIFEADFMPCSYGYRPGQGHHKAIAEVHKALESGHCRWAVLADIHDYFGCIIHRVLIKLIQRRIADKKIIRLIACWLKTGKLDWDISMGIGQGCPIGPLLSNIYLHQLDQWWDQYGPGRFFRYCDNFLVLLHDDEDPEYALLALSEGLIEAGYMVLNGNETKIIDLKKAGFTFLGTQFLPGPDGPRLEILEGKEVVGTMT